MRVDVCFDQTINRRTVAIEVSLSSDPSRLPVLDDTAASILLFRRARARARARSLIVKD